MLFADCCKERQSLLHSSSPRVSLSPRGDACHKEASELSGTCADTVLGGVCLSFGCLWKVNTFVLLARTACKVLKHGSQLHIGVVMSESHCMS